MTTKLAKVTGGLLAILMMFLFATPQVLAAESSEQDCSGNTPLMTAEANYQNDPGTLYRYQYINSTSTSLGIQTNGRADMRAKVIGLSTVTRIDITITLQKRSTSGAWSNYCAPWSQTFYAKTATLAPSYSYVTSGAYRIKADYKVYSGSAYEAVTEYSPTSSY